MFEHRNEPLLPREQFYKRLALYAFLSFTIVAVSLAIGVLGYHYFEGLSWIDSLVNASMILGGMGPVDTLHTTAGKIFASLYALFSGMILLVAVGVLIAPVFHRFMHHLHLEIDDDSAS
ncbi:MAG TPA: hypothetical protein VMT73_09930 [Anaerolineales bacterium]|nr:hypothetical protein [Anaerolineales bacterium]